MSVARNLVSERARRIPVRVFKIHKRNAVAMKFTYEAAIETVVRVAKATVLLRCFIQHVGVVRNFDVDFIRYSAALSGKFSNLSDSKNACHICVFGVLASLSS